MADKYLEVKINAEDREQADKILNALLEKKIATGGQIVEAPERFWWKGEIVDMDYVFIYSYTKERHKEDVIKAAEKASVEEVPMITFTEFDGNKKLLEWIAGILD